MKGNVQDIVVIGALIFATSIAAMFGYLVLSEFYDDPNISANPVAKQVQGQAMDTLVIFGNALVFLTIGFGIASGISAFYTDSHPIFFIFSILMFCVLMIPLVVFSDVFTAIASQGAMLPIANEFTLMVTLMQQFPTIGVILLAVILLGLYAKWNDLRNTGGGMA